MLMTEDPTCQGVTEGWLVEAGVVAPANHGSLRLVVSQGSFSPHLGSSAAVHGYRVGSETTVYRRRLELV